MSLFGKRSEAGFTLIELLVVIFIIGIITTVVIVSFRAGDKRKTLQLGVEEVNSLIRDAQSRSLSGQVNQSGSFPPGGYGVYVGLNESYAILFQDLNSDQKYEGPKTPPFQNSGASNEYLSHVKLRTGISIIKIFKDRHALREVTVVFLPPRPTMYFAQDSTVTAGEIIFTMQGITDQREIFLNCISGQIDVRSLEGGAKVSP